MYEPSLSQLVDDHGGPANCTFMVPLKVEHPVFLRIKNIIRGIHVPVECKLDFSKYEGENYKVTVKPLSHFTTPDNEIVWWYSKDFYCSDFMSLIKDGIITICPKERIA
jgi:hypothetical protein